MCAYLRGVDSNERCKHTQPHHLLLGRQALLTLALEAQVALLPQQRMQVAIVQSGSVFAHTLTGNVVKVHHSPAHKSILET